MSEHDIEKPDPLVSRRMSATPSRDTMPEMRVRRILRDMGYGYRLHAGSLPGTPDIVLRKYNRAVIDVRGCFWHYHECGSFRLPKSNVEYWMGKLSRNRDRDACNEAALMQLGWRVLVVWECELKDEPILRERLRRFLDG